jgi:Tfp pilus assembly protein PilF
MAMAHTAHSLLHGAGRWPSFVLAALLSGATLAQAPDPAGATSPAAPATATAARVDDAQPDATAAQDATAATEADAQAAASAEAEAALVADYPELEPLPLAALLLSDGLTDRAEAVLDGIRLDRAERDRRFDWARYHTLRALIAQSRDDLPGAAAAFEQAIAASDAIKAARAAGERRDEDASFGVVDPLVYLYLAQAWFAQDQHAKAIDALERAGDQLDGLAGAWNLRAHAHWTLGQRQQAFDTLHAASARFPANASFLRRSVFYLIEAGLYQEAARAGMDYLKRADARAEDYLAIGTALRRTGSLDQAIALLETGRLRHPDDDDLAKALAQTWLDRGQPLAAAELLASVAERDPSLLAEAAELFRRAGHSQRALNFNARVTDPDKKLKQRVGILLELRRYDQVAGMEDALARARLLGDEDIRYALAYALFRSGRHEDAEIHLQALTRPDLFRKSTELRRLMEQCADQRWTCA